MTISQVITCAGKKPGVFCGNNRDLFLRGTHLYH
jgi:hypothetical protein